MVKRHRREAQPEIVAARGRKWNPAMCHGIPQNLASVNHFTSGDGPIQVFRNCL
jgi:hypothetical protein